MKTKWEWGLSGGLLIANPVPEEAAIAADALSDIIDNALADARANHITGKEVTPYLLDKIRHMTDGKSLVTNQELVRHNAKVAAQIAVAYAKI